MAFVVESFRCASLLEYFCHSSFSQIENYSFSFNFRRVSKLTAECWVPCHCGINQSNRITIIEFYHNYNQHEKQLTVQVNLLKAFAKGNSLKNWTNKIRKKKTRRISFTVFSVKFCVCSVWCHSTQLTHRNTHTKSPCETEIDFPSWRRLRRGNTFYCLNGCDRVKSEIESEQKKFTFNIIIQLRNEKTL